MTRDEELILEQIAKAKAERNKCEIETKEIKERLAIPWYRRAHLLQAVVAGLVAVPLIWFYVKEVAIPIYAAENNKLALDNSVQKKEIEKAKQDLEASKKVYADNVQLYLVQNESLQIELTEYKKKAEDLQKKYEDIASYYDTKAKQAVQPKEQQEYTKLAGKAKTKAAELESNIQRAVDANTLAETRSEAIVSSLPASEDGKRGFIWIGNYDEEKQRWTTTRLKGIDGLLPDDIKPGSIYRVLGNMTLRADLPKNDADYFRSVESLGYVPKAKEVKLLSAPKRFDRQSKIQYWVEVEQI